ncbi:hypothetical protein CYMTET_49916 [Cymbomonas tetramitiformis]|uniref:Uncharacterized protein n=1 Tax=Cymbomonas tetramitiformis TaxID=36881 RepID=A0AAE0EU32_9CHLO|nr:hypothetical protein CYMTET_49916 [Cymbomonas tetramitiformis]
MALVPSELMRTQGGAADGVSQSLPAAESSPHVRPPEELAPDPSQELVQDEKLVDVGSAALWVAMAGLSRTPALAERYLRLKQIMSINRLLEDMLAVPDLKHAAQCLAGTMALLSSNKGLARLIMQHSDAVNPDDVNDWHKNMTELMDHGRDSGAEQKGKRSTLWTNLKRTIVVPRGHIGLKSILKKAGRLRTAAAAACAFLAMHEETAPIRLDPYSPSQRSAVTVSCISSATRSAATFCALRFDLRMGTGMRGDRDQRPALQPELGGRLRGDQRISDENVSEDQATVLRGFGGEDAWGRGSATRCSADSVSGLRGDPVSDGLSDGEREAKDQATVNLSGSRRCSADTGGEDAWGRAISDGERERGSATVLRGFGGGSWGPKISDGEREAKDQRRCSGGWWRDAVGTRRINDGERGRRIKRRCLTDSVARMRGDRRRISDGEREAKDQATVLRRFGGEDAWGPEGSTAVNGPRISGSERSEITRPVLADSVARCVGTQDRGLMRRGRDQTAINVKLEGSSDGAADSKKIYSGGHLMERVWTSVWTSDSADHHGKFEGQQELEEMCGAALMHLATVKHVHSIGLVRQTIGMVNLSYDAHGQMGVQVHTPTIMFLMTTMWGMARSDRVNRDSFHRCNTIGTIGSLFKRFPHFLGPLEPLAERDAMSARMRRLHAAEAKHQQEFLTGLEYAVALLWLLLGDEVEDKCITPDMSQSMREWKVEGDGVSKQVEGVDLQEAGPRMPRTSHVQGHVGQLGEDHTRMVKGRRQWPEEAEASSSFHEGAAVLMEVMRMPSWSGNVTMQRLAVRALWQLSYRSKQLQALFTDGGMPRAMLTLMSKAVDTALSVEATYALQLLVRPDDPGEGAAVPVAGDGGAEGAENRPEEGGKLREEIKAIKKRRTQERRQKQAMWEKMNDSRRLKAIARSRTSLARTQDLIVEAARQCDAAEHLYDQKWWSFYIADLEQEIQEERATITKLQDPGTEVDTLGNIVVDPELEALKKESMLLKADIEDSIKISSLDPDHSLLFCKPKEQERMTLLEYNWPAQEEHNATFQTQEDREEEVEERMGQERMIRYSRASQARVSGGIVDDLTEEEARQRQRRLSQNMQRHRRISQILDARAKSENKTLPDAKVHYDAMTLMLVQLDRPEWEIAGAGALGVGRWAMYKGNKKALLSLHTIPLPHTHPFPEMPNA